VLVVVLFSILWRSSQETAMFAISFDDFSRTLIADRYAHSFFEFDRLWPPLPPLLNGLALYIWPQPRLIPGILNFCWSTLALLGLARLGKALGLGPVAISLAVAGFGLSRWSLWLSWSGLAEPLGLMLVLWALSFAWESPKLSGILLCLAGACRYELWGVSLLFSGWVFNRDTTAALLPWIFPISWVGLQLYWEQKAFGFAAAARDSLVSQGMPLDPGRSFADLVAVAGWGAPLGMLGLPPRLRYFTAGTLVLTMLAWALGYGGLHTTPRHYLVVAALLMLGTGAFLEKCFQEEKKLLATLLLIGLISTNLRGLQEPPPSHDADTEQAARYVAGMYSSGRVQGRVVLEVSLWEFAAFPVLTDHPGKVDWDRNPWVILDREDLDKPQGGKPPILLRSAGEISELLARGSTQVVVTARPETEKTIKSLARKEASFGRYTIFLLNTP
jgi:hypothetical protein